MTFLRPSASTRDLDLPPPYTLVTTREVGDAMQHARAIADRDGAGTLVWVRRFDLAEFAVVLEPEEPLAQARRAFCLGMEALARALSSHSPPQMAISFDWPDGIRVDGVLLKPPYVIDAIGNPDTLAGALEFQDGFTDDVEKDNGTVSVKKGDPIEVTVTRTPTRPRYAEPVPGQ